MKVLEALNALQEPYRTQALNNRSVEEDDTNVTSISQGLEFSFVWSDSPEDHDYWEELYTSLIKMGL